MIDVFQNISNIVNTNLVVKKEDTEEQKKFINSNTDKSIILTATAGSGKTYSCVGRLKHLLNLGVKPEKLLFFSFTTSAIDTLRERINNDHVKITTIHSFCYSVLTKCKKWKEVSDFHQFINWYKHQKTNKSKTAHEREIDIMYDNSDKYSSDISTFKLMSAAKIKSRLPPYLKEYQLYLKTERKRDFVDMLVEVLRLTETDIWKEQFEGKYDYVFVDEYQDTSSIQMQILCKLNAKYYCLVGDRNQAIYNFSGSNCVMIEKELKQIRPVEYMNLSVNFRSDLKIVENANRWSSLKAITNSSKEGSINFKFIGIFDIIKILSTHKEVALLVRTNHVIKQLEFEFLKKKIPLHYFNYITESDIKAYHDGKFTPKIKSKFLPLLSVYGSEEDLIGFIETHRHRKQLITTIHKSKGKEYDTCIVINSFSPDILEYNNMIPDKEEFDKISFNPSSTDPEPKNIHYVACTRPKHNLYFAYFPDDIFEI